MRGLSRQCESSRVKTLTFKAASTSLPLVTVNMGLQTYGRSVAIRNGTQRDFRKHQNYNVIFLGDLSGAGTLLTGQRTS